MGNYELLNVLRPGNFLLSLYWVSRAVEEYGKLTEKVVF